MQNKDLKDYACTMLYQAYNDGVFGVPFFILNKEKFWGTEHIPFIANKLG